VVVNPVPDLYSSIHAELKVRIQNPLWHRNQSRSPLTLHPEINLQKFPSQFSAKFSLSECVGCEFDGKNNFH
jgi:hypothetical protein